MIYFTSHCACRLTHIYT